MRRKGYTTSVSDKGPDIIGSRAAKENMVKGIDAFTTLAVESHVITPTLPNFIKGSIKLLVSRHMNLENLRGMRVSQSI